MKVIEISNKIYLIRHWFVWYRVQRGASRWDKLEPVIKNQKSQEPFTIEKSLDSLKKAGKVCISKPSIDI